MKTVGLMLKEARLSRGLTLADIEKGTKIREKFLEGIEEDDYSKLPSLSYAKGFVKNYSEYVGLNSRTVLAFFRRQTVDIPKSHLLPKGVHEPLNRSPFQLTPGKFIGGIVISLVAIFLLYLGFQYRAFTRAPALLVETPAVGAVVTQTRMEVLGATDQDATVTINGVSVLVRSDGKFFDQVSLAPGINAITIVATSRFGKTTTVVREVGLTQ